MYLFSITANSKARVKLHGVKYMKDGKEYMKFDKISLRIQIEDAKFNMSNLFNGDPVLSNIGNQFINENSRLFLDELIPGLEKSLADIFGNIAEEILNLAPYEELFPLK